MGGGGGGRNAKTSSAEFQALAQSLCHTINISRGTHERVQAVKDGASGFTCKTTAHYSVTGAQVAREALSFTRHEVETKSFSVGFETKTTVDSTYEIPLHEIGEIEVEKQTSSNEKVSVIDDKSGANLSTKINYQVYIYQSGAPSQWEERQVIRAYSQRGVTEKVMPPSTNYSAYLNNFSDMATAQTVGENLRRLVEMAKGEKLTGAR